MSETPTQIRVLARVRAWIRREQQETSRSPGQIARSAGLDFNALRGFERQNWRPRTATVEKLEALIPADFTDEDDGEAEAHRTRRQRKKAA